MFKVLFVCGLIVGVQSNITKLVNITQGPVLGYKAQDAEVFEFYGIPYATAPTGRDKFKVGNKHFSINNLPMSSLSKT